MLLNFVDAEGASFALLTTIDIQPDRVVLMGEPLVDKEALLQAELVRLNNELAVLAHERTVQGQAIERAHKELNDSHWHLKKSESTCPSACCATR